MDDWFGALVAQVSDEVAASSETQSRLELVAGRVTREQLKDAAVKSETELRRQFASRLTEIQDLQDGIRRLEQEALPRESRAVEAAEQLSRDAVAEAEQRSRDAPAESAGIPGRVRRLQQKLHISRGYARSEDPRELAAYTLYTAQKAYGNAKAIQKVDERPDIRRLKAEMDIELSALRDLLSPALMLKVNEVIDGALEDSYERVFSYNGPPVLTDQLKESERPVDTDAYREIEYLIGKVRSGTIGVAGPRGSGKSTLLKRFASTIRGADRQWGVYVPAPAKYDSRDFLLYLFAELCLEVLGEHGARQFESQLTSTRPPTKSVLPAARVLVFLGAVVLGCFALVIALHTVRLGWSPHRMIDLAIVGCSIIVLLMTWVAFRGSLLRLFVSPRIARGRPSDTRTSYRNAFFRLIFSPLLIILLIESMVGLLFFLVLQGPAPDPGYLAAGGLAIASMIGLFALTYGPLRRRMASDSADDQVDSRGSDLDDSDWRQNDITAAQYWYAKVKFQQSFTTGWSGTITVGASSFPVQAQGGRTGSTGVAPLAMSTPEIVGAFNKFTRILARAYEGAQTPVVIGIDEIDKIEDPRDAQAFFNQIKGLFADNSCLFLVSISDDALAAFERRGMPFRDAFDSSLSSVVTLSYLSRKEARTLIGRRLVGVQEPVADLLFVLAGGLPRDLVRLIRRAVEAGDKGRTELGNLALTLIKSEIDAKQKAVLAQARTLEPCPARDSLLAWAGRRISDTSDAKEYFDTVLTQAQFLIDSSCDSAPDQTSHRKRKTADTGDCFSKEIGVLCFWLATVGQVFSKCLDRNDFEEGESTDSEKSFERLTEARQNFSLGLDYVLVMTRAVRTAWALSDEPLPLQMRPDEPFERRLATPGS